MGVLSENNESATAFRSEYSRFSLTLEKLKKTCEMDLGFEVRVKLRKFQKFQKSKGKAGNFESAMEKSGLNEVQRSHKYNDFEKL